SQRWFDDMEKLVGCDVAICLAHTRWPLDYQCLRAIGIAEAKRCAGIILASEPIASGNLPQLAQPSAFDRGFEAQFRANCGSIRKPALEPDGEPAITIAAVVV